MPVGAVRGALALWLIMAAGGGAVSASPPFGSFAEARASAMPEASVMIVSFAFEPDEATLVWDPQGGNRVTFSNEGFLTHRVRSQPMLGLAAGACFDAGHIGPGQRVTVSIDPVCAGAVGPLGIAYHDPLFAFMEGTLRVRRA